MTGNNCESCIYFNNPRHAAFYTGSYYASASKYPRVTYGDCRRYPPQIYAYHDGESANEGTIFPTVEHTEWCGEYDDRHRSR